MLNFLIRLVLAVLSGAAAFTSYEPLGWWAAGILAGGLLYAAVLPWPRGRARARPTSVRPTMAQGAAIGFVHGMSCYLLLLPWIGEFVGNPPYIALAIACSLYTILTGLGGVALARSRWGFVAFPLWYLAIEFARSSFPFGGFGWVRLAWGQIEGPLAGLAQWGGPALVTVAAMYIGVGLAQLLASTRIFRGNERTTATSTHMVSSQAQRSLQRGVSIAMIIIPLLGGAVATLQLNRPGNTFDEITVAAIQGNVPRLGLDFAAQRRAVLNNHVRETKKLADDAADIDVIIWPENSSDVNPFSDQEAYDAIASAVEAVDTPIVVGTITHRDGNPYNTMQVFAPDATAPRSKMTPGEFHDKVYLQPFGETLPLRGLFEKLSEYAEMAGNFVPGDGNGVLDVTTHRAATTREHGNTDATDAADGHVAIGVATCYEVAFDEAFRRSIDNGASILTSPTNNATFGFTDMTYQQLAMSRMRAIETDRAVVVPATSGVSALVDPAGKVLADTEIFEANHLVDTLPLRSGITPAVRYGQMLELVLVVAGVLLGSLAVFRRRVKE